MWDERTTVGVVDSGEWLWCGRWALARVGERDDADGQDFLDKMTELLCNVNAIAPLAEVMFWGARDVSQHPWEQWTAARQPLPSPGPLWGGLEVHCHSERWRDASLGRPARDVDFERGRAEARPVDTRPARELAEAVARVDAFLHYYTSQAEYFEDGWPLLIVLLVSPNDEETGVDILFSCEGAADAYLQSLCERAISALAQAHPNLGYDYSWELVSG
jgi:hypothetical protein